VCRTLAFKRCSRHRSIRRTASARAFAATLCLALIPLSFAPAQWWASRDAETCVTGTGVRNLDIAVCGRALGRRDLSELDRASVLTVRGRALRDSGKPAAALADFDAALRLNPHSVNAFHERALTLDGSGDYERALEDFRRAIALSPRFAAAHKNRAVAHFYAGNPACARVDLDTAAALDGTDAEIYVFRGFLHYLAGRYAEAGEDFERADALHLPYAYLPLWRYLAGVGNGSPNTGVLVEARAALSAGEWPQPLLETYLGALGPETLIATIENHHGLPGSQQRLAASHYYLAALERLSGRGARAGAHLASTLALSENRTPERVMAEQALAPAARGRSRASGECARDQPR
jgi:lipoprotein NlpI